jgi:hypothetical protein
VSSDTLIVAKPKHLKKSFDLERQLPIGGKGPQSA